jgi:hypothetical protein
MLRQFIIILLFSYHRFSFPWYFSSWASGEPYLSGFVSDCSTFLTICDVPSTVVFLENLLSVVLVLFPDFLNFYLQFPWSQWCTGMTKHFMFHIHWIWYISMENHGGLISIWEIPESSTRGLWQSYQQSHLVAKQEGTCEENTFYLAKYLFYTSKGSFTCRKILRHGTDGFTPPPRRKVRCGFLSPIKIRRPRPGLNPRTLRPMASTLTIRSPRTTWILR